MVTSRQVRAARALLGTQDLLADKALVALTALKRSRRGTRLEKPCERRSRPQASCSYRPAAERASCWSGRRQDNRTKRLEQARTTSRGEATLTKPRIDAPILDQAPTGDKLTDYDRLHLITYIRLLDADTDGIPWEEASRLILHIDPDTDPKRAKCAHHSHLARAQWMTRVGYRHILTDEKLRKSGDSR
jgi:hypothetical protein